MKLFILLWKIYWLNWKWTINRWMIYGWRSEVTTWVKRRMCSISFYSIIPKLSKINTRDKYRKFILNTPMKTNLISMLSKLKLLPIRQSKFLIIRTDTQPVKRTKCQFQIQSPLRSLSNLSLETTTLRTLRLQSLTRDQDWAKPWILIKKK